MKQKKSCRRHTFIALLMLLSLLSLPPMAISAEKDALYSLPFPGDFTPVLQADGSPQYITADEIEQTIKRQSREFKKLYHNRRIPRFIVSRHEWLDDLLASYAAILRKVGIQGKAETWDCENYSGLLNALATIRIWRAGYYDTRGAIGWMRVNAQKEWAGIPGELHALMFAVTEDGMFVIEPQNGQTAPLEKYPNRHYIEEVYLF